MGDSIIFMNFSIITQVLKYHVYFFHIFKNIFYDIENENNLL